MIQILNLPRSHKRGIRINPSGQINIRQQVAKMLSLQVGDKVVFCYDEESKAMFLYKDNDNDRGLVLKGRNGQLSCQSQSTCNNIRLSISGLTAVEMRKRPIQMVCLPRVRVLNINGTPRNCVEIINRF